MTPPVTLKELWEKFAFITMPAEASPGQKLAMRCAFHAGALSAMHIALDAFKDTYTEADRDAAMQTLAAECIGFLLMSEPRQTAPDTEKPTTASDTVQ